MGGVGWCAVVVAQGEVSHLYLIVKIIIIKKVRQFLAIHIITLYYTAEHSTCIPQFKRTVAYACRILYAIYGTFCKTFSENNVNLERKKKGPDGSLRYHICRSSTNGIEAVFQLKTT